MISRLIQGWRAILRKHDLEILWPAFKKHAQTLDQAKAGFMIHASNDPAWTTDYTEEELVSFIDKLE